MLSDEKSHAQYLNRGQVSSPSNIEEIQETVPFKPMIIKSNSQAINGGFECKTTTKKSPKGEKLNNVSITAKMPSSTTNQSATKLNLKINNSKPNGIS